MSAEHEHAAEVNAAMRRILVGWGRRYASAALLVVGLGLVVAVYPSRSPVQAIFDPGEDISSGTPISDGSRAPATETTTATTSTPVQVPTTTAFVPDTTPATQPPVTTPFVPTPTTPSTRATPTTAAPTTTEAPAPTTTERPPSTTTTTMCTVGALGVCAAP